MIAWIVLRCKKCMGPPNPPTAPLPFPFPFIRGQLRAWLVCFLGKVRWLIRIIHHFLQSSVRETRRAFLSTACPEGAGELSAEPWFTLDLTTVNRMDLTDYHLWLLQVAGYCDSVLDEEQRVEARAQSKLGEGEETLRWLISRYGRAIIRVSSKMPNFALAKNLQELAPGLDWSSSALAENNIILSWLFFPTCKKLSNKFRINYSTRKIDFFYTISRRIYLCMLVVG